MKYAVIQLSGGQHKVTEGQKLTINNLTQKEGESFEVKPLLVVDGSSVEVGTPEVSGATVAYKVLNTKRGRKINVFVYRSKSRYRRHTSIKPIFSQIEITKISTK
jgi:large subunit ribosomal protein L21